MPPKKKTPTKRATKTKSTKSGAGKTSRKPKKKS
jgi:hypothetical protein